MAARVLTTTIPAPTTAYRPRARRVVALAAVVLAGGAMLGGCAKEASSSSQIVGPVMVELADLDGATVTITTERPLVVPETDADGWQGTVTDPAVAEFVHPTAEAGSDATFNSGFDGVGVGTTQAELTSPTGEAITFTIVVEAAAS